MRNSYNCPNSCGIDPLNSLFDRFLLLRITSYSNSTSLIVPISLGKIPFNLLLETSLNDYLFNNYKTFRTLGYPLLRGKVPVKEFDETFLYRSENKSTNSVETEICIHQKNSQKSDWKICPYL